MNFGPLFLTARVVSAVYKVASTSLLMLYLIKRVNEGRKISRKDTRKQAVRRYINHE